MYKSTPRQGVNKTLGVTQHQFMELNTFNNKTGFNCKKQKYGVNLFQSGVNKNNTSNDKNLFMNF